MFVYVNDLTELKWPVSGKCILYSSVEIQFLISLKEHDLADSLFVIYLYLCSSCVIYYGFGNLPLLNCASNLGCPSFICFGYHFIIPSVSVYTRASRYTFKTMLVPSMKNIFLLSLAFFKAYI